MKNMLDKQVVKKEFKKDLGLDKWGKQKDPRSKMELRHQQVNEKFLSRFHSNINLIVCQCA